MQRCSESEFLEFRQRIKESIRKNTQVENDDSSPNSEQSKRKLPYNDFGSFFGPSQTVIAPRVLRESKPMFENKLLAEKMLNSIQSVCSGSGTKNPKEELKRKVEKLKDSRDYSFLLSDDDKLPVPIEEPPSRNPATPNPKPDSSGSQLQPRLGSSTNGKKVSSVNSQTQRKSSKLSHQRADSVPRSQTSQRPLTSSKPLTCVPRSPQRADSVPRSQRPLTSSKPLTCVPRNQGVKQRKVSQEVTLSPSSKNRVISKPPLKQQPHHQLKKKKLKKKMSKDDELALEMVRKMCKTDRYKGRDFDDYDDENMETNFQDLIKEEKRSEKLAKKEDAEQLRLIEEEKRQERAIKEKKKKQKLSH